MQASHFRFQDHLVAVVVVVALSVVLHGILQLSDIGVNDPREMVETSPRVQAVLLPPDLR